MPEELSGMTCALSPKIQVILKIFEPITLPNANCVFFFSAATSEAANSGNEVPQAMSVNEINASLTPKFFAIKTALSTKKSQLTISIGKPSPTFSIDFHNASFVVFFYEWEVLLISASSFFCLSR